MRFNRSKDGVLRATLRVEHRVGLDMLIIAAVRSIDERPHEGGAQVLTTDDLEALAASLTRSEIEERLRNDLAFGGSEVYLFADERAYMGQENWAEAIPFCEARVLELWPELTPTEEREHDHDHH